MATSESYPTLDSKKSSQGEEEVAWSEESKQLLVTLPKQRGWGNWPYLFQYEGFWYTSPQLQGTLTCRSHFQTLPSDVLLVTFPKSGTTWLKSLLFSILNRHIHPINAPNHHPLTTHNPHDLVPFIERLHTNPQSISHPTPRRRLLATHMPASTLPSSVHDSGCKMVYLCRDPRDTFVSLWHFLDTGGGGGGFAPLDDVFDKFCQGVSVYGPFWDHVLGHWKESLQRPNTVSFLKFEDLKGDPLACVERLAEFLGCPFSPEEVRDEVAEGIVRMCDFGRLSSLQVNKNGTQHARWPNESFFRRGEVGDWVHHLTPEMSDKLVKIVDEKLRGSGMKFDVRSIKMQTSQRPLV